MTTPAETGRFVPAGDLKIEALCNAPDDVLFENIRVNGLRPLPWLVPQEPNKHVAVLVGGGPSLKNSIGEIQARSLAGQYIFALNGAGHFLQSRGIVPQYLIMIDSRPENIKFVRPLSAVRMLLASQCHPSVFDALEGEDVTVLHPMIEGIEKYLPKSRQHWVIGGGITAGLTAMAAVHTMGYRDIHLYGYDSSDAGGQAHAYEQHQNDPELRRLRSKVAGREFYSSFAMYKQAEEFPKLANMLADDGAMISVHGDGLLPTIAREMSRPRDASRAVYDLAKCPASYDFIGWLVAAEMNRRRLDAPRPLQVAFSPGPNGGFRNDALPVDIKGRKQFLDHVMRPALSLIGAIEDDEVSEDANWFTDYGFRPIVEANGGVPKLVASDMATAHINNWLHANRLENPFVITLREATHWPSRNSNVPNWLRFAEYLRTQGEEVVFVRDTEKARDPLPFLSCPMASNDLHCRMALYARAKLNFITSNGPMALLLFSDAPFVLFEPLDIPGYGPANDDWWVANHGIERGEKFPWMRPDQRIIWGRDDYHAIRAAYTVASPEP